MTRTFKNLLIMLFMLSSFLPMRIALADTGPKPSMDFEFTQGFPGQPVTITSGILLECEQSDCQDAKPLQKLGPQQFSCAASSCSAMAYGFSTYHRIEIQFSDGKTRQSNIFKTAQFQSKYKVTIRPDDLLVEPLFSLDLYSPVTYILLCAGCLAGIVILGVIIILIVRRTAKKK